MNASESARADAGQPAAADSRRPIVVTGCPRSGTTFVGKIIGQSPEVFYIYEPFNDEAPHHLRLPERFIALDAENGAAHRPAIDELIALGRPVTRWGKALRGAVEYRAGEPDLAGRLAARALAYRRESFGKARRVCIKDPLAFFAAEWLADTYDAQVVVMLRHPGGVISSYLALDWPSEMRAIAGCNIPLADRELAREVAEFRPDERSALDGLLLQWRLFTRATLELKQRRPDWIFLIHDRLCLEPETYMRDVYARLDLPFSADIASRLQRDTTASAPADAEGHVQHRHSRDSRALVEEWRERLDPSVADRILAETGDLWEEALNAL